MNSDVFPPSTRLGMARLTVLLVVLALLVPSGVSALTHDPVELQRGTIDEPADGTTVIAVQGFKLAGQNNSKKPARLVGVGPEGDLEWVHEAGDGIAWFYDVDPLEDGTLLVAGSHPSGAVVFKYDPATNERVWTERLGTNDTHDADIINEHELLVADMRAYNESTGENDAGLFVYNRTSEEVVYRWHARSVYNRSQGGPYEGDWSHINDVDKVDDGEYMLSVRNMDEVVLVNRSTDSVDWRLGADENLSVLYEQHNPQYIEREDGTPTVVVADSENDRVVEYEMVDRGDGDGSTTWNRTWTLGANGSLNWPRDADRLPNGNTLVTDSLNHRVLEVTPEGQVVWEYYAPWGTYEAERVEVGDEPGGPTVRDQGGAGAYGLNGSAALTPGATDRATFGEWVASTFAGTPLSGPVGWFGARWSHAVPWIRPVWMRPWAFVSALGATLVAVGWTTADAIYHRRQVRARLGALGGRLRRRLTGSPGTTTEATDSEETTD
ncbi:ArsR family transcriptional regulator [Halobacteriales archaeon QH_10_67_22]|nr:MAG: ArsR family transcriptional regulator [Halobacteriales archaeon QH_10_67_22]